jgi:tRNA nucleotidyltransferase (CCA-adding enzyme)
MPAEEFRARLNNFDTMVGTEFERQKGSVFGKLAVNGDDLKLLGCKPGPGMGALLKFLEELVIETPDLNEKTELLRRAEAYLAAPPSK